MAGGKTFKLNLLDASERYMTGLQVKKDPGVWIVWLGCTALILGFAIVFWVGHRRTWLYLGKDGKDMVVLLGGQTNKNRLKFEQDFEAVAQAIDEVTGEGR